MIDECMVGCIDMIVTKSIIRFARNTLDCLNRNIAITMNQVDGSEVEQIEQKLKWQKKEL